MSSRTDKGKGRASVNEWSEWVWDEGSKQHYRTRPNKNEPSGYDYQYYTPPEVPRSERENTYTLDNYKYASVQTYPTSSGNVSSTQTPYASAGSPEPEETTQSDNYQAYSSSAPTKSQIGYYTTTKLQRTQVQIPETPQDPSEDLHIPFKKIAISPIPGTTTGTWTSGLASAAGPSSAQYPSDTGVGSSKGLEVPANRRGHIGPTPGTGNFEPLDSNYRVHKSKHFIPGKVFKILWSEPRGETGSVKTERTQVTAAEEGKYGEAPYQSIRRFIIVATSPTGSSSCVPILTYQHQGTAKHGVNHSHHAIIYTSDKVPAELPGEPKLFRDPIRMVSKTNRDKLAADSRINYAKIYTVEHNVKVLFIGELSDSSRGKFMIAFNEAWEGMNVLGG